MPPVKIYSLDEHKLRWSRAMEEVVDTESVMQGLTLALGERAVNCFDFENGVRLVAGRESAYCEPGLKVGARLHICVLVEPGSPIYTAMAHQRMRDAAASMDIAIRALFAELSGLSQPLKLAPYPLCDGSMHWMIEPDPYLEPKNVRPQSEAGS